MRTVFLAFHVLLAMVSVGCAQGVDLTTPPDFKVAPPTAAPKSQPAKKKAINAKHAAAKSNPPLDQHTNQDLVTPPRAKTEENPLSFGMKWNGSNASENSTRATSGLTEDNKNRDGEAAGVGAKLGLGYKF
jgi:predicted small lipoprotein YifL